MIRSYKDIKYSLRRSKRKTTSIYVERDGQVSVLVPEQFSDAKIDEVIEKKRYWIYQHLAEWHDLNAARVEREYVNGEGFLYLGRSYRLKLVKRQAEPLLLKNGYFCLRLDAKSKSNPDDVFKDFYRKKGKKRIADRVEYFRAKMGVTPRDVRLMELKNRWASCSATGNLNFHWKCMMAPPTILDYIVVHELAHLIHPNHTDAFWNEVDKVMPNYLERKEWLRVKGAGMGL
ncbi:MAG: M48 family metallopeptidase [Phycisphaerae bacterium]|nr:M48 family metallopeptidase [Phycisphaerae bacterium]